jgi:NADH:ubiquinone oxidoreductase subunit K
MKSFLLEEHNRYPQEKSGEKMEVFYIFTDNLFWHFVSLIFLAFFGLLMNRDLIIKYLIINELLLIGFVFSFVILTVLYDDVGGLLTVFFLLFVSACDAAVGLGFLVISFRLKMSIFLDTL